MERETRKMRAIVGKSGGHSGKNTLNYKVSIPSVWANKLNITQENRDLIMIFDGEKITIQRPVE